MVFTKHQYWDGPVPTKLEKERGKAAIRSIIEEFPHGELAKNNPHYVDEYLGEIDLDLPQGITTSK